MIQFRLYFICSAKELIRELDLLSLTQVSSVQYFRVVKVCNDLALIAVVKSAAS